MLLRSWWLLHLLVGLLVVSRFAAAWRRWSGAARICGWVGSLHLRWMSCRLGLWQRNWCGVIIDVSTSKRRQRIMTGQAARAASSMRSRKMWFRWSTTMIGSIDSGWGCRRRWPWWHARQRAGRFGWRKRLRVMSLDGCGIYTYDESKILNTFFKKMYNNSPKLTHRMHCRFVSVMVNGWSLVTRRIRGWWPASMVGSVWMVLRWWRGTWHRLSRL